MDDNSSPEFFAFSRIARYNWNLESASVGSILLLISRSNQYLV
ncbi:hypothetical protein BT93_H0307 [Corymbia citriodora subsp. variegata]|nr:hypothetical protein BT93_H0307 [Corymbia citriodora subsp. variegata]